jgi:hypothetical protein
MYSTVLIETQYFPPIQTIHLIANFQNVWIEAYENYQKRSFRNRCAIATSNGVQVLSIPLKKGKNNQQPIRDVQIAYDDNWQKQHWHSLQTAYGKSPFWEFYTPQLEPIFLKKYTFLFDLNFDILTVILKILKLNKTVNVSLTESYIKNYESDSVIDLRFEKPSLYVKPYPQVFEDRHGFLPDLSVLDLIFCCGNQTLAYILAGE